MSDDLNKDFSKEQMQSEETGQASLAQEEIFQTEESPLGDLKSQYNQLNVKDFSSSTPPKKAAEKKKPPVQEQKDKKQTARQTPPSHPASPSGVTGYSPTPTSAANPLESNHFQNIQQERAQKAQAFTLKIEEDNSYMQADGGVVDPIVNVMSSTISNFDETAAQVGASNEKKPIDKAAKLAQERAFYEMQNKKNHPEKKPVKVRHNKRTTSKRKHKKKGGCIVKMIIALSIVLCATFLSYFIMSCANDLLGLFKEDKPVIVKIPEGASTSQIADILNENGLIDQPTFFTLFSKLRKYDGDYNAGTFYLNAKSGYEGMIIEMQRVEELAPSVRVTIIEGWNIDRIAEELEKKEVCEKELFMKALEEGDFDYSFINEIGDVEGRFYKLEGYLFPDTYDFFIGERPEQVLKKFFDNFDKKFTDDFKLRADELGMSVDEVVTLASIIQAEAIPDEMANVSSVFHNRLNNARTYPKLQSDPTTNYVTNVIYEHLAEEGRSDENKFYNDHYNTYDCNGLPSGPIGNPGKDAIEAALYPSDSNYFYFVTDVVGKNRFFYAETLSEHNNNIKKAERINQGLDN